MQINLNLRGSSSVESSWKPLREVQRVIPKQQLLQLTVSSDLNVLLPSVSYILLNCFGINVLKHIDLRKTPSLEFGMMIIFAYLPYGLAEGISLSGKLQKE